jgi:Short C-terminal domain
VRAVVQYYSFGLYLYRINRVGRILCKTGREISNMQRIRMAAIAGAVILPAILSGCFSFQGGDETVYQQRSAGTDQELRDLKAAYDRGIISEREYNQQRDRLLGR